MWVVVGGERKKAVDVGRISAFTEGGDCVITKKIKREKGIERRMFRVTHADTDRKGQQ